MDFILNVVDALLEVSGAKERLGRNEQVIRLKKRFGLGDVESLTKFEDVYAYALVEYAFDKEGRCKPDELIQLFKTKEVRDVFRIAYRENDAVGWLQKGEAIARHKLGSQLPEIDPQRELGIFAALFIEIVKQTRSPKEIRQEQKLDSLQRSLQQVQMRMQQLPSLEAVNQLVNQLAGVEALALPAAAENSNAADLARQLGEWFEVLDYDRDQDYEVWEADHFEWIINFPVGRRRVSRTLVRGVAGEVSMADLQAFHQAMESARADEGWLVGNRRVSKAARIAVQAEAAYEGITCYTFDELLDEDADFSKYLDWLEAEIKSKGIDTEYLPLACRKDELDPVTQRKIGMSIYGEEDGWIDGYVDTWLDDPAKEHLSVLGEFGTGKTWFALHYAWVALQRYRDAKRRGIERPRIPVVVPLRDYAKAVTVKSLFSEFFFDKHEMLKSYSVFEKLNRMGKLLLIFDGFDEMAARVNRQAMIDNFWELAKVVVPGAKAILTCRTEHFPNAMEGRTLLSAELQSSTAQLTGETPQFEVLELEMFGDEQIREIISRKAQAATVPMVMKNSQLLDLARRPVMVDLILEALPDIEAGKPVDMARVYLYAVTRKMENDIKSERTFTSLADKLYFLCELSWEMLSTDQMSLNYRAFPKRLRQMFADRMSDENELDHWRYDMMGQTMLIRNSEGDYSPAHRSLLEFFAAYKIVASLGVMTEDFIIVSRNQSAIDIEAPPQNYPWDIYFIRQHESDNSLVPIAPLKRFSRMSLDDLLPLLSSSQLTTALLDLAHPMLSESTANDRLLSLLWSTRERSVEEIGYFGGNIGRLMLAQNPYALSGKDLSETKLKGIDFSGADLQQLNLRRASLPDVSFPKAIGTVNSVAFSSNGEYLAIGDNKGVLQIWDIEAEQVISFCSGHFGRLRAVEFSPSNNRIVATGSDDKTIKLWSVPDGVCIGTCAGHEGRVRSISFSPDGRTLASSSDDKTVRLWSTISYENICIVGSHLDKVSSVAFSPDGQTLATSCADGVVKIWSTDGEVVYVVENGLGRVNSICFSPDGQTLAVSSYDDRKVKLWSTSRKKYFHVLEGHTKTILSMAFSPDSRVLVTGSSDRTARLWSVPDGSCIGFFSEEGAHEARIKTVAFSPDGLLIATGSDDRTVKLWSSASRCCIKSLEGCSATLRTLSFSPDGKTLASGSDNERVKLWSVTARRPIRVVDAYGARIRAVVFSPDGRLLASASDDRTVKLWSLARAQQIGSLEGHSDRVRTVAFSPDGHTIATSSRDRMVKLWSVANSQCIRTLENQTSGLWSVAFNPDGRILATGDDEGKVKLWTVDSGQCVRTIDGHSNWILSVTFSPDGKILATCGDDRTVKLWSMPEGVHIQTFRGHHDAVWIVTFSPDGKTLATGSDDGTVRLWSIERMECTYVLEKHSNWVRAVTFSPDGETLATGSDDETIRLWNVRTGECLWMIDERVCAGMNISDTIGLTDGQRTALKLMGAVENSSPRATSGG